MKKIIISCGGTGGHFYPGLAMARENIADGGDSLLLLSGIHAAKQAQIARQNGVKAVELPYMPSPGKNPARLLKFFIGLLTGFFRAKIEIIKFKPDEIWGMGSFAQLPVIAAHGNIPVFLHDGNARIGKANRFLSFMAQSVATAFPAVNADKCKAPVICIGMPLRQELKEHARISKAEAIEKLNEEFGVEFSPGKTCYLIVGGSQGAATLNTNIPQALKQIKNPDFQVMHLAGPNKLDDVKAAYQDAEFPVLAIASSEKMQLFYGAADRVFSRSGGSTVAELILFRKKAVLVPYPYAAEDHQADNARYMVSLGNAVMVRDEEFTAEKVLSLLQENPE